MKNKPAQKPAVKPKKGTATKQEKPDAKKQTENEYTPAEFRRLLLFAKDLPDTGRDYDLGKFNEVPAGDFIDTACSVVRWECNDPELRKRLEREIAEHERQQAPNMMKLGKMAFEAFSQKDAAYFTAIALYIECNSPGGPRTKRTTTINGWKHTELYPITYRELGIKKKRGQNPKRWTLDVVFPLALHCLIIQREHFKCLRRITRNEVANQVNGLRRKHESITESELSRQLTKWKFAEFVA